MVTVPSMVIGRSWLSRRTRLIWALTGARRCRGWSPRSTARPPPAPSRSPAPPGLRRPCPRVQATASAAARPIDRTTSPHRCQVRQARSVLEQELGVVLLVEEVDLVPEQGVGGQVGIGRRPARTRAWRAFTTHSRSRRSDASLRSLRPFWRSPKTVPSPRISRSTSASSKPSVGADHRLQARLAVGRRRLGRRGSSTTGRAPRPTRPRSWWSWARPKRSASIDDHHGGVGHVDADLDHGRGDEHVELAGAERGPSSPPSRPAASGRAAGRAAGPASSSAASRSKVSSADADLELLATPR